MTTNVNDLKSEIKRLNNINVKNINKINYENIDKKIYFDGSDNGWGEGINLKDIIENKDNLYAEYSNDTEDDNPTYRLYWLVKETDIERNLRVQYEEKINSENTEFNENYATDLIGCMKKMLHILGGNIVRGVRSFAQFKVNSGRYQVQEMKLNEDGEILMIFDNHSEILTNNHNPHSIKRMFGFISNDLYRKHGI